MERATQALGAEAGRRWLGLGLALAGGLGIACALLLNPELAVRIRAMENALTPERASRLLVLRLLSGALGAALLVLAIRARWLLGWIPRASARSGLPIGALLGLAAGFGALLALNLALRAAGLVTHTAQLFPVSIVRVPELHGAGLPWAALFGLLLAGAVSRRTTLSPLQLWGAGTLLLLFGNLAQGGWDAGFLRPFYDPRGGPPPGVQYYHDALRIADLRAWLAGFNEAQSGLLNHSRTHPPFAVLIHRWLLDASGERLGVLAGVFVLVSSLAVPLVWDLARRLGVARGRASELALLFAVLPAFNVYGAVSLDGLVLTSSTLALWGWVAAGRGSPWLGAAGFALGFVATQLLSFAGLFLVAALGLLALHGLWTERRAHGLALLALGLLAFAGVCAALQTQWGYDHLAAFRTASRLENPAGFRALSEPWNYAMTRVEGVAEIALFFSLPALAVLLLRIRARRPDAREPADRLLRAGCAALAAMLLAGAWWTGETARTCLFLYPYLVLGLRAAPAAGFGALILATGAQTVLMQSFASFFW
jgi:hypothetical protein